MSSLFLIAGTVNILLFAAFLREGWDAATIGNLIVGVVCFVLLPFSRGD